VGLAAQWAEMAGISEDEICRAGKWNDDVMSMDITLSTESKSTH